MAAFSRARRRAARAARSSFSIPFVVGCAIRSVSSSVATASWRLSSVAASSSLRFSSSSGPFKPACFFSLAVVNSPKSSGEGVLSLDGRGFGLLFCLDRPFFGLRFCLGRPFFGLRMRLGFFARIISRQGILYAGTLENCTVLLAARVTCITVGSLGSTHVGSTHVDNITAVTGRRRLGPMGVGYEPAH